MSEIKYVKTTEKDMENLMKVRLEMLREVNNLPSSYEFDKAFIDESIRYFEDGEQTTVLAFDKNEAVGCATMSYVRVMPTFAHPTGKRAHLMNVYTRPDYRRQGISAGLVECLIGEAKERKVTEISLDATEMGRPLYEKLGFTASTEGMVMKL